MEETLYQTAVLHKRLTSLPPGLEVIDFLPNERELYDQVSQDLFTQLSLISQIKNKYAETQQKKLKKTFKIGMPKGFASMKFFQINETILNVFVSQSILNWMIRKSMTKLKKLLWMVVTCLLTVLKCLLNKSLMIDINVKRLKLLYSMLENNEKN
jgi:hypothetical protein